MARHTTIQNDRSPRGRSLRNRALALTFALVLVVPVLAPMGPAVAEGGDPGDGSADPSASDGETARMVVGFYELPPDIEVGSEYEGGTVVELNPSARFIVVEHDRPDGLASQAYQDRRVRFVHEEVYVPDWLQFTPNDPSFDTQYGPQQVALPTAWDTTLGTTDKAVCIVDTGVRYTHEEIAGTRWLGGHDFVNDDADPNDDHGHGTHVAGIAAATINNGKGIAGAANVGILATKVLSSTGGGTATDVANGITWCADNGADIISMSLGASVSFPEIDAAIDYAWGQGTLLVAAAGNSGPCSNCISYPARHANVIAVTCTTSSEAICSFSSTGPEAELAAPGYQILSLGHGSDTSYATFSGTSMSTPLASGVAALVWSHKPALTHQDIRDVLAATASDRGSAGHDTSYGYGIVNAATALNGFTPTAPLELAATLGTGVELSWLPPADNGSTPLGGYRVYRAEVTSTTQTFRDDDGTSEFTSDFDYRDDYGEKRLILPSGVAGSATEATLHMHARAYDCDGPSAEAHRLDVNGAITYYNPCLVFPTGTADWASFTLDPADLIDGTNRFSIQEVSGDWTDHNLLLSVDQTNDFGRSTIKWDGDDIPGELMWYLEIVAGDPLSLIAETGVTTTYQDTDVAPNTTYRYGVSAFNDGGEGALSNEATVTTPDGVPSVPLDLLVQRGPGLGNVTLGWSAPATEGDSALVEYRVYRGPDADSLALAATVPPTTTGFADTGLQDGTTFAYAVSAANDVGEGPRTAAQLVRTLGAPLAPGATAAAQADQPGAIDLSWEVPADDGGSPLTAYRVHRGTDPGALAPVAELDPTQLAHVDTGLADGTQYFYAVSAVNEFGEGATGSVVDAATAAVPAAPASAIAARADGRGAIDVAWQTPPADGGLPITTYRVYRGTDPGSLALAAELGASTLSFSDTGLADATTYHYAVSGVNDVGEGPASSIVSATTATEPGAPRWPGASAGPGPGEITLGWAAPTDTGGISLTTYRVYRATDGGTPALLTEQAAPDVSYKDTGLPAGPEYCYTMTALNDVGEGPPSIEVCSGAIGAPDRPQDIAAEPGPNRGRITVTWAAPFWDGGADIEHYRIYRGPTGDMDDMTRIAQVGDVRAYEDTGLADGAVWSYRVSAYNGLVEGPLTEAVSARAPVVSTPPQALRTTPGPAVGEITVQWNVPADDGGLPVLAYRVYAARTPTALPAVIAEVDGSTFTYVDEGLLTALPKAHWYWITAVTLMGESPRAGSVCGFSSPWHVAGEVLQAECDLRPDAANGAPDDASLPDRLDDGTYGFEAPLALPDGLDAGTLLGALLPGPADGLGIDLGSGWGPGLRPGLDVGPGLVGAPSGDGGSANDGEAGDDEAGDDDAGDDEAGDDEAGAGSEGSGGQ